MIDNLLGVGKGLLCRSCFFGQHSHTQQALLGLSDRDLKRELNLLVDTQIWNSVVVDLKAREKTAKEKMKTIDTTLKLRTDDLKKKTEEMLLTTDAVHDVEVKIEEFRNVNTTLPTRSADEVEKKILNLEAKAAEFRRNTWDSLQNERNAREKIAMEESHGLDLEINTISQTMQLGESALGSLEGSIDNMRRRITNFNKQAIAAGDKADKVIARLSYPAKDTSTSKALKDYLKSLAEERQLRQERLLRCDLNIKAVNESLLNLEAFRTSFKQRSAQGSPHQHDTLEGTAECPTCGQNLQEESATNRSRHLNLTLESLEMERKSLSSLYAATENEMRDLLAAIQHLEDKERIAESLVPMKFDLAAEESKVEMKRSELEGIGIRLKVKLGEKTELVTRRKQNEKDLIEKIRKASEHLSSLSEEITALKREVAEVL